jgi:hypothetical protein
MRGRTADVYLNVAQLDVRQRHLHLEPPHAVKDARYAVL